MKIVLIKDVPNLGKAGELLDAKPSFVLNYLMPKNLAVLPGDTKAREIFEAKKAKRAEKNAAQVQEEELFEQLNGKTITFSSKADKNGRLYGSIGPKAIAEKLALPEAHIKIHLKELGDFPLEIKLGEKIAKIKIVVKKEK